jgi:signal transduction histidine kinase
MFLPAVALALVVPLLLWQIAAFNRVSRHEDAADDAVVDATTLQTLFAESANSERGYVLTASRGFLKTYLTEERAIHATFAQLKTHVDAPAGQRAIDLLYSTYLAWHARADAIIALRQKANAYPTPAMVLTGEAQLERVRGLTAALVAQERAARHGYSASARRTGGTAAAIAIIGTVLVVGLLLVGARQTLAEEHRRAQREWEERTRLESAQRRGRELQAQNLQIQESARLKSNFVANMSHELRTPLTAILGLGEMLRDEKPGPLNPRQADYLNDIISSGRHLLRLINDVLDLAKIEAGTFETVVESTDPSLLARESIEIVRTLAGKKGVRIVLDAAQAPTSVMVDTSRFRQILFNYLSNAIKFSPNGGTVTVRIVPGGGERFRLEVEDNGPGIPTAEVPKLFVEFSQLDPVMSKRHDGAGLGLALTKRIVEAQGGSVGVRSTAGTGSTFFATLPIGAASPSAVAFVR